MAIEPTSASDLQGRLLPGVLEVRVPSVNPLPLLFDSPHSGLEWPDDFSPALDRHYIDRASDMFVDQLFDHVTGQGACFVRALFPRTYIDPNRAEHDLDHSLIDGPWLHPIKESEKTRLGKGLIWRLGGNGQEVYNAPLAAASIKRRIDGFYRPYHQALAEIHQALGNRYGQVWHINCHSMKSVSSTMDAEGAGNRRFDVVISDREGEAADASLVHLLIEWLKERGLRVALNDPFKGAEILRRHGQPNEGRHAIQLELNRALYMDEIALTPNDGFEPLREILRQMNGFLVSLLTDRGIPR